jgi:hypothetical protein
MIRTNSVDCSNKIIKHINKELMHEKNFSIKEMITNNTKQEKRGGDEKERERGEKERERESEGREEPFLGGGYLEHCNRNTRRMKHFWTVTAFN